jgi:hypothetical protein
VTGKNEGKVTVAVTIADIDKMPETMMDCM